MNNQYYLRCDKLLPGNVRHKHDRDVKQGEIYFLHVVASEGNLAIQGGKLTK